MRCIVTGEFKDSTGERFPVSYLADSEVPCDLGLEAVALANRMGVQLASIRIDNILELEDIEKPGIESEALSYFIKHMTWFPAKTY